MTNSVTCTLTMGLVVTLSTAIAEGQALPNQSAATTTNIARVYVQTAKGVNVYTTSSIGKLTLVSGSPFKNTVGTEPEESVRAAWGCDMTTICSA